MLAGWGTSRAGRPGSGSAERPPRVFHDGPPDWRASPRKESTLRVEELMTSPVHTAAPDSSLKEMARFLVERGVGCVPIVDAAGALIGIVTEADLMQLELHRDPRRHLRPDRDEPFTPPPTTAGEIMTTPVVAVPV